MATVYLVRKTGNDNNGGTSKVVRSTGTDGVTAGTNTLTSVSSSWGQDDVGHGIFIGGVNQWRTITAVTDLNTLTFSGATIAIGVGRTWTIGGAWLTISNVLVNTATAITGSDLVYIGAGTYRETITVGITSPVVETMIIGDVDGSQTGDSGEVIWSAYTAGDKTTPSTLRPLTLNTRDFLTFQNIIFIAGNVSPTCVYGVQGTTNIKFYKCQFISSANVTSILTAESKFSNINWLIDSCAFVATSPGTMRSINIQASNASGADYNLGIVIKNCSFFGISNNSHIEMTNFNAGSGANFGGGINISNCTLYGGVRGIFASNTSGSISIPILVTNCLFLGQSTAGVAATTQGQIIEDNNVFMTTTARSNVTAGVHSIAPGTPSTYAPLFQFNQEIFQGKTLKPFFSLMNSSPLIGLGTGLGQGFNDIMDNPYGNGNILLGDYGIAAGGTANTLTDGSKNWGINVYSGYNVKITAGAGYPTVKTINGNSATGITVDGNWLTAPNSTSTYNIYKGSPACVGIATSGDLTRIADAQALWQTNQWLGFALNLYSGSGSPTISIVSGNTATVITATGGFTQSAASGSFYKLYKESGEFFTSSCPGAFQLYNTAVKETGTFHTIGTGLRIQGPGSQDFKVPVNAQSTTIEVWANYDSEYSGVLPQLIIKDGGECGVSSTTGTMTVGANTWEQLQVVINPTQKGVITARFQSNSVTPVGAAFFDDFGDI